MLILLQTVHEKAGRTIHNKLINSLLTPGCHDSCSYLKSRTAPSRCSTFLSTGIEVQGHTAPTQWLTQWSYLCAGAEGHILCLSAHIQLFGLRYLMQFLRSTGIYKGKDYLLKWNVSLTIESRPTVACILPYKAQRVVYDNTPYH